MLLSILATKADALKWNVAQLDASGVYSAQQVAVTVDPDTSGNIYAAPYTVYHKLDQQPSGFNVPITAQVADDGSSFADVNILSWNMTVKNGSGQQVSTCSGNIDSRNCDEGNWCNTPCQPFGQTPCPECLMSASECEALGWPEGCGTLDSFGNTAYWADNPWVNKCSGGKNDCLSNDSSCCESKQSRPGAQFCDTVWLHCSGSPQQGETYTLEIKVDGTSPWSDAKKSATISSKYTYGGDGQAYVGTYECSQPRDNNDTQICGSDPTKWEFKQHPKFHYNEYDFGYPSENNDEYIVGAYWTEWAAYKRFPREAAADGSISPKRRYYVQNSPFHQLTHVLYAFVPICGNGPAGEGQLALCAVNDCASDDAADLKFGNPYFNLRARACKFDSNGNEASTAAGGNLESDFELALHDPWSAFHIGGGQLLALESVKQQYPDLKILPSVGGWTLSKMFFYMNDPNNRAKFVNSCEKFLRTWKVFDGIDIDWEFPGGGGQDDGMLHEVLEWPLDADAAVSLYDHVDAGKTSKKMLQNIKEGHDAEGDMTDANTYTAIMHDLRVMLDKLGNEFGRKFELSSAVSAGKAKIERVKYGEVADVMDHIFIMSYDLDGAWSDKVGHQTNLYPHPDSEKHMDSCSGAAEQIAAQGFPMSKLVMGAAMYGRGWQNVGAGHQETMIDDNGAEITATNWFGHGTDDIEGCIGDVEQGVVDYSTIKSYQDFGFCEYFYDSCAEAPLANCGGQVYTYDNPRSVAAKGKYVQNKGMGGIFAWVLDQDNGDILNAMHESVGHKVIKGTKILNDSYPERTCNGNVIPTEEPVTPPEKPVTDDMKCCVKVSSIDSHAMCTDKSESQCGHSACEWTLAENCVDAVYSDGVVVPTAPPKVTTTAAPKTTTTAAPQTTTTAAPKTTTTAAPKTTTTATTKATTTAAPSTGGACKDIGAECDAQYTDGFWNQCSEAYGPWSGAIETDAAGKVINGYKFGEVCPQTCAGVKDSTQCGGCAGDSPKATCAEWKNPELSYE